MILYIGASIYHILCFSLHKLKYHPQEKAVLVIVDNIFSKSGMKELKADIDAAKIFARTIILHYIEGAYSNPYVLKKDSSAEQIDQYIAYNERWIEQWMKDHQLDLCDVTEYNTAINHRHFGLYLLSKNIPYQYFEDGNGLLSREQVQREFHKKSQYDSYAVTKRLGGLGNSSCVTKKYANQSAQVPGFYDEKMEDFNVISLFAERKEEEKQRLLKMFHAKKLHLPPDHKGTVLYLTRYVRYLQKPTIQNHHYLSAMILDLFAEGNQIVIKPHPRDFSGRYRELFSDAVVLDKHFPSELLPFLYDEKFEKIITIGSTAIDALDNDAKEIIKLEDGFENRIEAVFSYIGALQMIKSLFSDIRKEEIEQIGCLKEMLDPLSREYLGFVVPETERGQGERKVIIVDQIEKEIPEAKLVLYLDPMKDIGFRGQNLSFIGVCAEPVRKDCLGARQERGIIADIRDPSLQDGVDRFCYEKEFTRTGLSLSVGTETKEQKKYAEILIEIYWMRRKADQESDMTYRFPAWRKKITQADVEALCQLRSALKKEEENQ